MNPGNDRASDTPDPELPISTRLAQTLDAALRPQLPPIGLELLSIEVEDLEDDDILLILVGTEISIRMRVKASYCKP